jgi:PAS domain S-box-containing protein
VETIFGYTKVEMCSGGANLWLGCIHPADFGRVRTAYEALFENQTPFEQEYRLRRKDGTWIWVYDRATTIHEENGVLCADGVLSDITERKRTEEELHSSRQMLQSILHALPQRVFWKDRNSVYLGCNRTFASDAGLENPAAIIGKTDFDLSSTAVAELSRADDKLVMQQGSPTLNFHESQTRSDGSVQWPARPEWQCQRHPWHVRRHYRAQAGGKGTATGAFRHRARLRRHFSGGRPRSDSLR